MINENLIKNMLDISEKSNIPQYLFVLEELSEYQKEITKFQRGKADKQLILEEFADVIASSIILLKQLELNINDIPNMCNFKYKRAIERFNKNGET